jgi:hypothetical protein
VDDKIKKFEALNLIEQKKQLMFDGHYVEYDIAVNAINLQFKYESQRNRKSNISMLKAIRDGNIDINELIKRMEDVD